LDPLNVSRDILIPPSSTHPLGTDDLGRDTLAGVVNGARVSLTVGIVASIMSGAIGVIIGSISGFYGGKIDIVLMRVTEIFQIIPMFFLAMVLVVIFGPTIWNVILVLAILAWPGTARITRAEFLSLKEQTFVEAARATGVGTRTIIINEILPNALPPIIVNVTLTAARAILVEAGLTFLGLGDPNLMSWGKMLRYAMPYLRKAWWLSIFPGLAISYLVIGLNILGEGLNFALNPRSYITKSSK